MATNKEEKEKWVTQKRKTEGTCMVAKERKKCNGK